MLPGSRRFVVPRRLAVFLMLIAVGAMLAACRPQQQMANQARYDPLEPSDFFADGSSARPLVEGTIPAGSGGDASGGRFSKPVQVEDPFLMTGKMNGALVNSLPFAMTPQMMKRGQERYDIYCAPCHGRVGVGDGMIVRRGYRRPPSLHVERLQEASLGHLFDVMTEGFGAMPPYKTMIPVEDRWMIAAYIRALQYSQNATVDDVPSDQRAALAAGGSR
jgi:mono/diheme cytochrome c family protein